MWKFIEVSFYNKSLNSKFSIEISLISLSLMSRKIKINFYFFHKRGTLNF